MTRLRRVSCSGPGLRRRRTRGGAFCYVDDAGAPVSDQATLERIAALAIPPAWTDVWVCPVASGHIQATGVDAKGRRQYRYHDAWRIQRDLAKHERVLEVAARLPVLRQRVAEDLATNGLNRNRVLACAVRLLDLGFFRIGGEEYAQTNNSYGLATIRKEHVTVSRSGVITFDYIAKSGKQRIQSIADPQVGAVVSALKRRRGGGPELLAHRDGAGQWVDVKSTDINAYLRQHAGTDVSAKDFRTWSATVLAAVGLAVSAEVATRPAARTRAVSRVVREVSDYLGNTPAVCRASYIDPRLFDLFEAGVTIAADVEHLGSQGDPGLPAVQGEFEAAVLRLLQQAPLPVRRAS